MSRLLIFIPLAITALGLGFLCGYSQTGWHVQRTILVDRLNIPAASVYPKIVETAGKKNTPPREGAETARQDGEDDAPAQGGGMSMTVEPNNANLIILPTSLETDPIPPVGRITRTNRRLEVISKVYEINQLYRSMRGPWSQNRVSLLDSATPELCWITGCHVEMVGADGHSAMPDQLMCHANLDLDRNAHRAALGVNKTFDERLFTLSQGLLHVEFPTGCGFPMMSNEPINLTTQVLNHNWKDQTFQVRHRVRIDFVRDRDLDPRQPMKPLYETGASAMKSLENRSLVYDYAPEGAPTASGLLTSMCMPGRKANDRDASPDSLGRKFTGHWIVKPGREENRTRVTTLMHLPWDTTIHHIAVHLHPFAESLELRDITTGATVFKSQATNLEGKIGLKRVEYFSSAEGLAVFKSHEYELVSHYNNTSDEDQDSMAVMYIYLLDKEFKKPTNAP